VNIRDLVLNIFLPISSSVRYIIHPDARVFSLKDTDQESFYKGLQGW
jgi:hypothetical protein